MSAARLSDAQLGRILPAFVRAAPDGTIRACGPAMARLVPAAQPGASLAEVFAGLPDLGAAARGQQETELVPACAAARFAGSVIAADDGYLLALHVQPPRVPRADGMFLIDDFAPGDPAVPMIMLAGVQSALITETKDIALDLAAERQRAVALLEEVTAAAGRTAHELNNLISTVGLTCDRALRQAGSGAAGGGDMPRLIGIIRETALRGAALTRAMMDLARRREEPERKDAAPGGRRPARVLVVEDEVHALEALAELLDDLGYGVTACPSAEVALAQLGTGGFEVLLTDVILPGMNGIALAERALAQDPNLRVVLMSGYLPEGAALREEWLFLRKPLDLGQLDGLLNCAARQEDTPPATAMQPPGARFRAAL